MLRRLIDYLRPAAVNASNPEGPAMPDNPTIEDRQEEPAVETGAAPVGSSTDALIGEIMDAIERRCEADEFFALLDAKTANILKALSRVYPREVDAKLFTLKITNLLVARFHFEHRHTELASGPIQLMLDPSNSCNLQCPGCVHTANPKFKNQFPWPGGLLSMDLFDDFISMHGPFAFGAVFYNYGEPFLNKKTPQMIERASHYLLNTCVSSNLSVPIDAEAVVRSGLSSLFASLDGATQTTYATYRRRGTIDVCFDNLRRLVDAKRRLGSSTPYLLWKFLTFEHNVHEIDLAIELAEELGLNELCVATPFAVDWDDPSVQVVDSPRAGNYRFPQPEIVSASYEAPQPSAQVAAEVDHLFKESWSERALQRGVRTQKSHHTSPTCDWLYQSITIDAHGNILPCCMPPQLGLRRVYGSFPGEEASPFNARHMRLSRLSFAHRAAFDATVSNEGIDPIPYCARCKENPELTYTVGRDVFHDLVTTIPREVISHDLVQRMTSWPGSGKSAYMPPR